MIDLGRAFKAPFEDREWLTKTLLGLLWGLLIVTSPAIYGAQVAYIRAVSRGDEALPTWDEFGKKWVDGLLVFLAGLVYFLPVVVLGAIFVLPGVLGLLAAGGNSEAIGGLFAGGFCLFSIVSAVYSIAVSVLFSAAIAHFAMRDSFGAFFEFGEILAKVRSDTGYFTAWLYTIVISIAASVVTSVLSSTVVGGILYGGVIYLASMMSGHLLGQWATRAYATASTAPTPPAYPTPPAPPAPAAPTAAPPVPPAAPIAPASPQPAVAPAPAPTEPAPAPPAEAAEPAPSAPTEPSTGSDVEPGTVPDES